MELLKPSDSMLVTENILASLSLGNCLLLSCADGVNTFDSFSCNAQ